MVRTSSLCDASATSAPCALTGSHDLSIWNPMLNACFLLVRTVLVALVGAHVFRPAAGVEVPPVFSHVPLQFDQFSLLTHFDESDGEGEPDQMFCTQQRREPQAPECGGKERPKAIFLISEKPKARLDIDVEREEHVAARTVCEGSGACGTLERIGVGGLRHLERQTSVDDATLPAETQVLAVSAGAW